MSKNINQCPDDNFYNKEEFEKLHNQKKNKSDKKEDKPEKETIKELQPVVIDNSNPQVSNTNHQLTNTIPVTGNATPEVNKTSVNTDNNTFENKNPEQISKLADKEDKERKFQNRLLPVDASNPTPVEQASMDRAAAHSNSEFNDKENAQNRETQSEIWMGCNNLESMKTQKEMDDKNEEAYNQRKNNLENNQNDKAKEKTDKIEESHPHPHACNKEENKNVNPVVNNPLTDKDDYEKTL